MSKLKWSNKKILLVIFGSLLLVLGGISLFNLLSSDEQQSLSSYSVYEVRETDPLIFEGKVQAAEEQEEYVDHSLGVIAEIEVEDGDVVEEGTVLFSYTNEENQQLLDEQNRLHTRTDNRLSEEYTNLANAQSDLETAEANISEVNQQVENHTPSEEAEFGFDQELESLQSDLATYESDKTEAEGTIESAQMSIRELEEQLEDITAEIERLRENTTTVVESTISGTIELNETVASRPEFSEEPLIRILSDSVIVEATVSEYDYNDLNEGSSVEVLLLNSEEVINGTISDIASQPVTSLDSEDTSSRYTFNVEPEEVIQYGFSVQVSYQDGTIILPESTLVFEDEETYVFIHEDGVASLREVSVREEGNTYILEEGLSVEDELLLDPLPELEDGEEIVVVDD